MDDIGHILVSAAEEDTALNDLSWWNEGLDGMGKTIDISEVKEPNNVKPELRYQWRGGPDFDFEDTASGDVKRVPRKDEANPRKVIHFARDMMNRGHRFSEVARELKARFAPVELSAAKSGLRKLAAANGLIGRFVLDACGYPSCKEAFASIQHSPWKSFIRYVVGCNCGDHEYFVEDAHPVLTLEKGKVASVDDVFVESKETKTVERCASTHLRIAGSSPEGWLDPAEVDQSFLKLSKMGYLPQAKVDELSKSNLSPIAKLCEAFKYIDNTLEKNENTKYEVNVDPSEYKMDVADNEIELEAVPTSEAPEFDESELKPFEGVEGLELAPVHQTPNDSVSLGVVDDEISVSPVHETSVEMDDVPDGDYEGADEIELEAPKEQKSEEKVSIGETVDFEI